VFFGPGKEFYTCYNCCRSSDTLKCFALESFALHKLNTEKKFHIRCCHEHHFMVESMNELVILESMRYQLPDEALPVYLYVLKNRCHIPKT
jgi:hypothetical protein